MRSNLQTIRKYSSEAPQKSSRAPIYAGAIALTAAGGYYFWQQQSSVNAELKERSKVFTGGDQGFVDLKLAGIEPVSHNAKKFRFEFPDKESVSGLHIACMVEAFFSSPFFWVGDDGLLTI